MSVYDNYVITVLVTPEGEAFSYAQFAKESKQAAQTAQTASEAARDIAVAAKDTLQPILTDLAKVLEVQGDLPEINAVYAKLTEINAVFADLANIDIAAGDTIPINALNAARTELLEVHTNLAGILNLNSNLSHVTTVEAALAAITTVSDAIANVNTVASSIANVNAVAANKTNIDAVAANKSNIDAAVANEANITNVATNKANIDAVAANEADIDTAAANIAAIQAAPAHAITATEQAGIATSKAVEAGGFADATEADRIATAADRVQTAADRVAVAADKDYVENLVITAGSYPLWYGVQGDTAVSSPDLTRIGNSDLHRELPIHNLMYACLLADNGVENYRLNPTDWTKKLTGGDSNLDGTDGQVMVWLPEFYYLYETEGTKWRMKISQFELPGFAKSAGQYVSAYEASVRRADNVLSSVKNATSSYRGGNDNAAWDAEDRSLLGMPATNISRTNFRTYARARGTGWEMYNYYAHWKMTWLFVVEYNTLNSQKAVNAALDVNGYKQGGLGDSVININSTHWNSWNSYYPFVPCGYSNSLGSGTGEVSFTMPDGYNSAEGLITKVNRYRGIEMPFGHIWKNADGVNVRIGADSDADPTSKAYVSENPAHWNDSNYTNYELKGELARANGYIKEMVPSEIVPLNTVGGGSSTYWCDYFYTSLPASGESLRTLLFGGNANHGAAAGLGFSHSKHTPSGAAEAVGSRLCFIPA